jgi:hemolysin activation/secretion protein
MKGLSSPDFMSNNAALSLYQTFKFPAIVTFAFRAGGGINSGSYEFYQAQVLDGRSEVRGFRKTRFYGDKKLFFNNEVRIKLGSVQSYLFPAYFGILGFYDVGRIWYEDETGIDPTSNSGKSSKWHKGFGGGLWFSPFNVAAVTAEVGHSVEGTLFYVRLGFLF